MNSNSLLVVLLFFSAGVRLSRSDPPVGKVCKEVGTEPECVCHHPKGTIDLRPLSSNDGPRFNNTDLVDAFGFRYYYNPCRIFSLADGCQSIFACQESSDASARYPLADQGTEKMYYDVDGNETIVVLYYSSPTNDGNVRETRVQLVCNNELSTGKETITTTGDTETQLTYKFTLTSCHACPGGCHEHHGGGSIAGAIGLSLIFLAIAALLAYFIIGAVIMQVHYKKTGLDIIPNRGFWFILPVLIKDGFLFVISPCMKSRANYQKM